MNSLCFPRLFDLYGRIAIVEKCFKTREKYSKLSIPVNINNAIFEEKKKKGLSLS